VAPKPASTTKAAPAPKAEIPADDEIVDDDPQTIKPLGISPDAFVIPTGKRQGQRLGDQTIDVIQWYASQLKPANDEQVKLQSAAQALVKVRSNGHEPVAA
jgi:hypothetical protein